MCGSRVPLAFDHDDWIMRFLANWPPGSAAHLSYFARITDSPDYSVERAAAHKAGRKCGVELFLMQASSRSPTRRFALALAIATMSGASAADISSIDVGSTPRWLAGDDRGVSALLCRRPRRQHPRQGGRGAG